MKTTAVSRILPVVRTLVLEERARGKVVIGLSVACFRVALKMGFPTNETRIKMTSWSPKKLRGLVQKAFAILATERLVFTRQRPEPGVERWAHGETDKYFEYRISVEDAAKRLKKTG